MKLNISGTKKYLKRNGIRTDYEAAKALGINVSSWKAMESGVKIGYDAVKEIYNVLGEEAVKELINFEGESLNAFKSKYVAVGTRLE